MVKWCVVSACPSGTAELDKACPQAYRSCLGLLRLGDRYGQDRLEAACRRALPAGIHTYKGVKNILDAKLDQVEPEEPPAVVPESHENVRGQAYYQ